MIGASVSAELKDMASDGAHVTLALALRGDVELGGSTVTVINDNVSLVSYDADGGYAWHRIFAAEWLESVEIEADAAGNIYVAGLTNSITFDDRLESPDFSDIWFVAKLSSAGDLIWSKAYRIGRRFGTSSTPRLGVDAQGNMFLTAAFGPDGVDFGPGAQLDPTIPPGTVDDRDAFLLKLDPLANPLWIRRFTRTTGYGTSAYAMGVDASGASVLSQITVGAVDLGGYVADCPPDRNCMTAAGFDATGNRSWIKQWTMGTDNTVARTPRVSVSRGSAFLVGLGSVDFGQGLSAPDSYVQARLDHTGALLWADYVNRLPVTQLEVSALAPSGTAYAAGTFSGDITIADTQLSMNKPNWRGLFVAEYDSDGSRRHARLFGVGEFANADAIVATSSGPVVAGRFAPSLELDRTLQTASASGESSVYVARLVP
jgi:hypothetical protein